jgi:hypothetical protein
MTMATPLQAVQPRALDPAQVAAAAAWAALEVVRLPEMAPLARLCRASQPGLCNMAKCRFCQVRGIACECWTPAQLVTDVRTVQPCAYVMEGVAWRGVGKVPVRVAVLARAWTGAA